MENSLNRSELPKYLNPPVIEVYCSVVLSQNYVMKSTFPGLFASKVKEEFSTVEEAPPLQNLTNEILISDLPPLRRVWFVTENKQKLIQIQENRFIFNWRKVSTSASYPHFENVFSAFKDNLQEFITLLKAETKVAEVNYESFELTYVNVVEESDELKNLGLSLDDVLLDSFHQSNPSRFLKAPTGGNRTLIFGMTNEMGQLVLNVHKGINGANGKQVLRYELTCRGMIKERSNNIFTDAELWFDTAHKDIVLAFEDSIHENVQSQLWNKKAGGKP